MALTALTKRQLAYLCSGYGRANDIVTIAEAGAGTTAQATKRAVANGTGSLLTATNLKTALDADSALGAHDQNILARGIGSQTAAADVSAELG